MKDEIQAGFMAALQQQPFDALLLYGVDHAAYAGRVFLPFAHQVPQKKIALVCTKQGRIALVVPFEWEQAVRAQGWQESLLVYTENDGPQWRVVSKLIADFLLANRLSTATIGVDAKNQTLADRQVLSAQLPQLKWQAVDDWMSGLRSVKYPSELQLLRIASEQGERGVIGALNHLEGTVGNLNYTMKELAERLRVHVIEFGGTGIGDLAVGQGEGADLFYRPAKGMVASGQFLRMEINNHYMGYWSVTGRTVFVGEPDESQQQAYADQCKLQRVAMAAVKPGVSAGSVFDAVKSAADTSGIQFIEDAGVGHGVGISEMEAPYLQAGNRQKLAAGMVLMIAVYTSGPQGELLVSKEMLAVTEQGNERLSTYKDWEPLYLVNGFRGTH